MNIPATKEEILENFKKNSNGRPLNKDDYEIAEALSRITYKAYEVGMEDAKQLNMEDMMDNKSKLQVFSNKEFGQIRTILIKNEIWFVARDIALALGYVNPKDAVLKHVDEEDRKILQRSQSTTFEVPSRGLTIINESGVYALIFGSKLDSAGRFKHWVTHDVLPTLRKTGSYSMNQQENKPDAQDNAILQVLMKNTEVLQAIVQQNQQIMIALTNLSVSDAKRTMEIKPLQRWRKDYTSRRHGQHRARRAAAAVRRCALERSQHGNAPFCRRWQNGHTLRATKSGTHADHNNNEAFARM